MVQRHYLVQAKAKYAGMYLKLLLPLNGETLSQPAKLQIFVIAWRIICKHILIFYFPVKTHKTQYSYIVC